MDIQEIKRKIETKNFRFSDHPIKRMIERSIIPREVEELPFMSLIFRNGKIFVFGRNKMSCVFCGGRMESKNVTFSYERNERLLLVQNVPAEVCTRYGEKTYSPYIAEELIKFADNYFKPLKILEVSLFDYTHKLAVV